MELLKKNPWDISTLFVVVFVPVVYLYDTVFGGKGVVERDAGAGAAIGVVLTLIIIVVYVITNLILKDSDLEY